MAKARVVANRTLSFVFVTSMLCLQMCTSLQTDTSIYTVLVFRRISFDIYVLSSKLDPLKFCDSTLNKTYLVNERECVSDQELYSGIYNAILIKIFKYCTIHYRMQLSNHSYCRHGVHHSSSRYSKLYSNCVTERFQ